jgi:hypothetical protein
MIFGLDSATDFLGDPKADSCSQNAHRNLRTRGKTGHQESRNALKQKNRPLLNCAHNPKVEG